MPLELIRPGELDALADVNETDALVVDTGAVVGRATPAQIVAAGRPLASESAAIEGTDSVSAMTPLTTKQAIDSSLDPVKATVDGIEVEFSQEIDDRVAGDAVNATAISEEIDDRIAGDNYLYNLFLSGNPDYGDVTENLGTYSARFFGAKLDGVTDDTVAIQNGINWISENGGGKLVIDGNAIVSPTVETDVYYKLHGGGAPATYEAMSDVTCLVLRSYVYVELSGWSTIKTTSTSHAVFATTASTHCGVVGAEGIGKVFGDWTSAGSGAGHGIYQTIPDAGMDNTFLRFENLIVTGVGSYGIGAQYGDALFNTYRNLYFYNIGADCIDHKVRAGSTGKSRGVVFDHIHGSQYGLRTGITTSAMIDIRGPATLSNIWATNFGVAGKSITGLRFSSATHDAVEDREASSRSSLVNFYIDSGHPELDCIGLWALSSEFSTFANGTIKGCLEPIKSASASSGVGDTLRGTVFSTITIEDCWGVAVLGASDGATFNLIKVYSQTQRFSNARGNLIAAQTTFDTPQQFNAASVVVEKNGVPLALTTDYTVPTSSQIVLTAGVLVTDKIHIITPTPVGFDIDNIDNTMVNCFTDKHTVSKRTIAAIASESFQSLGNNYSTGHTTDDMNNGIFTSKLRGPDANYDYEIHSKGTGSFGVRANGKRALIVSNDTANSVNFLSVKGSITGQALTINAVGDDANIGIEISPKGTGRVKFGTRQAIAAETVTGFIEIMDAGGTIRKLAVVS